MQNTMNKLLYLKGSVLTILLSVVFFGVGLLVNAQTTDVAIAEQASMSIPTMGVDKITTQISGRTVTGTFTLNNSETASFGNLQYQISLIDPRPKIEPNKIYYDNAAVFDRYVSPDIIEIAGRSSKQISFAYALPKVVAGPYRLRIQVITTKGVPMGQNDANLNLNDSAVKSEQVTLYLGNVVAKSAPEGKKAWEGLTVEPDEEFTVNFDVKNDTEKTLTLTPSLTIWEFAKNRTKTDTISAKPLVIARGKTSQQLVVRATNKPEAYHAEIVLKDADGNPASNIGEYRWVVSGPSAEISFIRVTKPAFTKGEVLSVETGVVGAADQVTEVSALTEVTIKNGDKTIATQKSDFIVLGNNVKVYTVNTTLGEDVANPVIYVRVVDSNENVLDEDTSKLTQPNNAGSRQTTEVTTPAITMDVKPFRSIIIWTVVILIFIIVIVFVGWLLLKNKKRGTGTTIIIALIAIGGLFFMQRKTLAVDTCGPTNDTLSRYSCSGYANGNWTTDTHCTCAAYGSGCPKGPGSERVCGPADSRFVVFSPSDKRNIPAPAPITEKNAAGDYVVHFSGRAHYYQICGNQSYPTTGSYSIKTSDNRTIMAKQFSMPSGGEDAKMMTFPELIADITFVSPQPNNEGSLILSLDESRRELTNGKMVTDTVSVLTQKINFTPPTPPLTCSFTSPAPFPASVSAGIPLTLGAVGGDPNQTYRWSSSNTADVFSPVTGTTTILTPQAGSHTVKVMNGAYLDVDGNGKVTMNDYNLVVNYLNGGRTPVPTTGNLGQNQTNPLDVNGDGVVNPSDIMFDETNTANYIIPVATCGSNFTVTQPQPQIKVTVGGIEQNPIQFGNVTKNTTVSKPVTITNVGDSNSVLKVNFNNTTISPANAFSAVFPPNTVSIPQGGTSTFDLTFSPIAATTYTSTLSIDSNASNTANGVIGLRGTGTVDPIPNLRIDQGGVKTKGPVNVMKGSIVTLDWRPIDADTCTASGAWTGSKTPTGDAATVTASQQVNTYTLSCTNSTNTKQESVTVNTTNPTSGTNIRDL